MMLGVFLSPGECSEFHGHWRNGSADPDFPSTFPYKLSLGVDSPRGSFLLPYPSPSEDEILVTK